MKSFIAMTNALKYYKHSDLIENQEAYQQLLSEDLNERQFSKMISKICSRNFIREDMLNK